MAEITKNYKTGEYFAQIERHRQVGDFIIAHSTNAMNIYKEASSLMHFNQPVTLLDIGCGYGNFTKALIPKLKPGSTCHGLDCRINFRGPYLEVVDEFYGDLIWVTYEVNLMGGELQAGDDAREATFFSFDNLPPLAFSTNEYAIRNYLSLYQDVWTLEDSMDSFEGDRLRAGDGLPSDTLFEIMVRDAHIIAENWVTEVSSHPTTTHYSNRPRKEIFDIAFRIISELGRWIIHPKFDQQEVWTGYQKIGGDRFSEGYKLSEVVSALSLTRKHIFSHVLAKNKSWRKPLQIYQVMEFMARVNLFYDKANYHLSCGYEDRQKES